MRILSGGVIYNFTVSQLNDNVASPPPDEFLINFRFRKSNATSTEIDAQRTLQIPRVSRRFASIMSDLLGEYEVPAGAKSDMAAHFKFHLERLYRMRYRGVTVEVKLDAETVRSERAEMMQNRIDNNNNNNNNRNRLLRRVRESTEEVMMPADKKAVAALERIRVGDQAAAAEEVEEKECAICLEKLKNDVEVIKMPCSHVYHTDCIIRWLDKNYICPFCRFKLPC